MLRASCTRISDGRGLRWRGGGSDSHLASQTAAAAVPAPQCAERRPSHRAPGPGHGRGPISKIGATCVGRERRPRSVGNGRRTAGDQRARNRGNGRDGYGSARDDRTTAAARPSHRPLGNNAQCTRGSPWRCRARRAPSGERVRLIRLMRDVVARCVVRCALPRGGGGGGGGDARRAHLCSLFPVLCDL